MPLLAVGGILQMQVVKPIQAHCTIPLVYLRIFQLMTKPEHLGAKDQIVTSKCLLEFWHRQLYNFPRKYDYHILTEMCEYGLLERINTQKYKFFGGRAYNKLKRLNDYFLF